jgi:hypothetical protein
MLRFSAITLALLLSVAPVHADAIDGDWCNAKQQHLTIIGPQITLPTGKSLTGEYERHKFNYKIPDGEAGHDKRMYLQLYDESSMGSFLSLDGSLTNEGDFWTRCPVQPKTS